MVDFEKHLVAVEDDANTRSRKVIGWLQEAFEVNFHAAVGHAISGLDGTPALDQERFGVVVCMCADAEDAVPFDLEEAAAFALMVDDLAKAAKEKLNDKEGADGLHKIAEFVRMRITEAAALAENFDENDEKVTRH